MHVVVTAFEHDYGGHDSEERLAWAVEVNMPYRTLQRYFPLNGQVYLGYLSL